METITPDLRYPIGEFIPPASYSDELLQSFIKDIEECPQKLKKAIEGLSEEQLDTQYRPGGWTIRQVIHHLPDSHMNAYVRLKLALTEDLPTIKPYEEHLWAELKDTFDTPVSVSIALLENLHTRWVIILRSLSKEDLEKGYNHPQWGVVNLKWVISQYSWAQQTSCGTYNSTA